MNTNSKIILHHYMRDALTILDHSIALFDAGQECFYRVAAVQLRLLLCDTNVRHGKLEEIALVPQLFPELMLLPVDPTGAPQSDRLPVDLKTWLNLPVVSGSDLTIRQLIRHVCDSDGGAHVDIKPLADLPGMGDLHQWMINISRYVSPLVAAALHD
jgi:hypothetical protein